MFLKIIIDSIRFSAIYLFGSAGETITEKSGHLNLGTPGIVCIGSMGSMIGAYFYISISGGNTIPFLSVLFPLLFCVLFAGLAGALFSFFAVTLNCNQNVTGLALTTFGAGLLPFVASSLDGEVTASFATKIVKPISHLFPKAFYESNWFTQLFFSYGIFVYLGIALAIAIAIFMKKTKTGLFLRTVGENPAAADAAGINVNRYRYLATIVGSAISGIAGLFYTFDFSGSMDTSSLSGYGWLALSLVIFTMWNTELGIAGSFMFAFLYISSKYANSTPAGEQLVSIIPYGATILVLVLSSIFSRKLGKAPAGLGVSYFREDR